MANKHSLINAYNAGFDDQLVLSYELLCLLRWLVEHDADRLKKIISKALASGLNKEIQHLTSAQDSQAFDQTNVIEFFGLLELLMSEAQTEHSMKTAYQKNLLPSIEMIDSSVDDNTVRSSIERTTSRIEQNPKANAKEILLQELLKGWKPKNERSN